MAELVPRYRVSASLSCKEGSLTIVPANDALVVQLVPLMRGPRGEKGADSTVPGPAGETPDVNDLELPVDPALLFLNALI